MTSKFTAKPDEVRRLFASVLPHTGGDFTLPLLACVEVTLTADSITVAATDRYSLAVCRAELSTWGEQPESDREARTVLVTAADMRRLFTFIAPYKSTVAEWEITDDRLTVTLDGGVAGVALRDFGKFPNWRKIIESKAPTNEALPGVRLFACTPEFLARFHTSAKALGLGMTRLSMFFPDKRREPVIIRIGDNFVGMLMPHNLSDSEQAIDLTGALGK